jgi:hypothetical protein
VNRGERREERGERYAFERLVSANKAILSPLSSFLSPLFASYLF